MVVQRPFPLALYLNKIIQRLDSLLSLLGFWDIGALVSASASKPPLALCISTPKSLFVHSNCCPRTIPFSTNFQSFILVHSLINTHSRKGDLFSFGDSLQSASRLFVLRLQFNSLSYLCVRIEFPSLQSTQAVTSSKSAMITLTGSSGRSRREISLFK
jgi:hypothetical protein